MMTTSSTVCSTSWRRWLDTRIVLPWELRWRRKPRSQRMPSGSRPLDGSSRTRTLGSPRRAAARPSRWRMPMLYSPARLRAAAGMPVSSSSSSTRASGTEPASARTRRWSRPLRPGVEVRRLEGGPHGPERVGEVDVALPVDRRGAARRVDEPEQHPQGGRLARAVGPEEAGDPARLDVEAQVVDGDEGPELLAQPPDLDPRPRVVVLMWCLVVSCADPCSPTRREGQPPGGSGSPSGRTRATWPARARAGGPARPAGERCRGAVRWTGHASS